MLGQVLANYPLVINFKGLGQLLILPFSLMGQPLLLDLKLNRIGRGHTQRGKNSFRLGFDGGSNPGPNRGGF